ncbi:hypothetical protein OKW21_000477 [Catalinimonas alkaloidigena]|uniref:hypothetical protein n=1 Tax=Catalinimonas alkaloidigena TaxID=1075417 RepID=UPI002405545D|nr:hypothetical protein [Catalinimonas alkaloidigena]MDF9795214.1 hypothetical protein [Catalinimonas alkaloidigena]
MKILRISFFDSNPWGDGGAKRTAQITEILSRIESGEQCIKFEDYYANSFSRIHFTKLQVLKIGIAILSRYKLLYHLANKKRPHTFLANVGVTFLVTKDILNSFVFERVILENTRSEYWYLPYFLDYLGIDFIALPHNLEALVPGQVSFLSQKRAPNWLTEELKKLTLAEKLFTISHEEAWLLSIYQLGGTYLPYWPADEVYQHLKKIRVKRKNTEKQGALIIGSATNPPTYQGMALVIDYFSNKKSFQYPIYLAGYQTDKIFNHLYKDCPDTIQFLGAISQERLTELLTEVKCVIINQQNSSGALTKILEFLIAGIPLVVNQESIRSYQNVNGIYPFYCHDQIESYLDQKLGIPSMPQYPEREINYFVNFVNTWIQKRSQF